MFGRQSQCTLHVHTWTHCALEVHQHWLWQLLFKEAQVCHAMSGNRGSREASDLSQLTSSFFLFSSHCKLVVQQIHLPNNSKNHRFVSRPEAQYSFFWPQEDTSQHRRSLQSVVRAGCRMPEWSVMIRRKSLSLIVDQSVIMEAIPPAANNLLPFQWPWEVPGISVPWGQTPQLNE
jgi:hypothetical protein